MALGNTADAVEILSAGYILSAFKQEDGSPLNSTQKGKLALPQPKEVDIGDIGVIDLFGEVSRRDWD